MEINDKSPSYLILKLNPETLCKNDFVYFHLLETVLKEEWNQLNIPHGQSSFKNEVDFLNARLIILFFDNQFRKDLQNLAEIVSTLSPKTIKDWHLKKENFLEVAEDILNPNIAKLTSAIEKLELNWAVSLDVKDSKINISSEEYAKNTFNLMKHNKKIFLLLKNAPNTKLKFIEEIGYENPYMLYLNIDLRYSVEVNLRNIKRTLQNYTPKVNLDKDNERFFRTPKTHPSNILPKQTRYDHFEFHLTAMGASMEFPSASKYKIAKISAERLSTTGSPNSIKEDDLKEIMTNLSQITRAFHTYLEPKDVLIYVDRQEDYKNKE